MSTNQSHDSVSLPKDYREAPIDFDYCLPHRQSGHSRHVTVVDLKSKRLAVKNKRRAKMGLPPIQ